MSDDYILLLLRRSSVSDDYILLLLWRSLVSDDYILLLLRRSSVSDDVESLSRSASDSSVNHNKNSLTSQGLVDFLIEYIALLA